MYKIIDNENGGLKRNEIHDTKESVRQSLISFHSIDWTGEQDIESMSLDFMLDYGNWELVEMTKDDLIKEIENTLSEIPNEDETLQILEDSMEYFCSTWDKCEGYKHAISETLNDQVSNHYDELETEDLEQLLKLLTK